MNAPETIPAAMLLPLDSIRQSPTNPRKHFDAIKLEELAISIKEHGLLQPILVRQWDVGMANPEQRPMVDMMSTYEIVCGERRWRASQIAGATTIQSIVRELTDKQALELQVVENLQREDVHPLEEAEGYERLMKYHDYTADTLGEKIGKSRAYIYARIKLLALAPAARELFYDGKLTASTALLIARIPGSTLQMKAAGEVTKPNYNGDLMSYRAAAEYIQGSYMLDLDEASFKMADATLVKKAGSCDACPHRSGNDLILFADVGGPNVCTNPPCFHDKREANFLRLKAIAEKSGKEVVTGKEAEDMTYNGDYSLRAHNLTSLDSKCHDDPDRRSYRDVLGPHAPAVTLVEDPRKKIFIEAVDTKLLATALKKAGVVPPAGKTGKTDRADQDFARERAEQEARTKSENAWRGRLFQVVRLALGERFAATNALAVAELQALAVNLFLREADADCNMVEDVMALWQHPARDGNGMDDFEEDLSAFVTFLKSLDAPALCMFLTDMSLIDEAEASLWSIKDGAQPVRLLAQAARLGIDAEALREPPPAKVQPKTAKAKATKPASTPSNAAQAPAQCATAAPAEAKASAPKKAAAKKPKAKADPAPTTSANEPAAPVTAGRLNPAHAWPFPVGPRP